MTRCRSLRGRGLGGGVEYSTRWSKTFPHGTGPGAPTRPHAVHGSSPQLRATDGHVPAACHRSGASTRTSRPTSAARGSRAPMSWVRRAPIDRSPIGAPWWRGRRLSDRWEWACSGPGRWSSLSGLQRRRGRARHVQGPHPAACQPSARRRRRDRGFCDRGGCLHLPQGQLRARDRCGHSPSRSSRRAGLCAECNVTHRGGARRIPVRRGEGDARGNRGQRPSPDGSRRTCTRPLATARGWAGSPTTTGLARRQAAPALESDPGEQRRDAVEHPPHRGPGCRVVPIHGHRRLTGNDRHDRRCGDVVAPDVGEVEMGTSLRG